MKLDIHGLMEQAQAHFMSGTLSHPPGSKRPGREYPHQQHSRDGHDPAGMTIELIPSGRLC
jgi:hypothetical protein